MSFSNLYLHVSNQSIFKNNNIRLMSWKYKKYLYYILFIVIMTFFKRVKASTEYEPAEEITPMRYQVAKFNFEEVSSVLSIAFWILLGSLAKIGLLLKKLIILFSNKILDLKKSIPSLA
jgi:hypothetical protein